MKNLTNILSYLWLLLLMAVTACSDLENEVDEMQRHLQEADLVELTIHPHVPGMKAGTRSIETDALTSIKVLAFNESQKLIKVVDATTNVSSDTSGSFSVKVPSKTRIIHFIGNPPGDVTLPNVGDSEEMLKNLVTSRDMSYWGYASFNNVTDLKAFKGETLTLYRNKAKISITAAEGVTASIAGVANAYQYGVLVPHNNDGFNFDLNTYDYQTLPSNTAKSSDQTGGPFTYVFEHPNDSKADALNVICLVDGKYYKVVLAKKVDDAMVYYDIIRNHQYNIKINQVDTNLGKDGFDAAAAADNEPINDVEVVEDKQVALLVTTSSSSTSSYDNTTYTVTVTTKESKLTDISTLSFSGLNEDIYQLTGTTGVTDNGNSYTVTADQAVFTFTLTDGYIGKEVSNSITFEGDGTHVVVTPATANLNLSTFADMYEMYFDDGNLGGSTEYDKFFYDRNNVNLQTKPLTTQYVDVVANGSSLAHNHVNAAINMQSNSTIKFTIAEERYLTLLVAANSGTPSINLLKDGKAYTTETAEALANGTYNFGAEGEIGTAGRLIRYELPAGTYTLQGSDAAAYLLYYMRVSTNRPTMTDANALLQPANDNYRFWWSGGEYGNWTYVENVGYVVDDDAKTFNVALTDDYLNNNGITGGELSLNSLQLNVTNSSFNNNSRDYTNTNNNSNVEISEINSGTYIYTIGAGVINNPVYKYTNFYDKIPVNAVNNGSKTITVKNSLKLKLVDGKTSYNVKENIVEYYTTEMTDPRLAIVSPAAPLKPHDNNNPFVCTIQENWQFKGANNKQIESNGQQVNLVSQNGNTFTIANGTEHYNNNGNTEDWQHPFWMTYIYYFDWGSFTDTSNANRSLSTMTISTGDTDIWFSYKNQGISKSMVINVNQNPGEVVSEELNLPLNIALDFYTKDGNGTRGSDFSNLIFGESRVVLEATITIPQEQNREHYIGKKVYLQGAFSNDSRWLIHWDNSRDGNNSDIEFRDKYNHDGTNLQFTIENDKTVYDIEWVFVRNNSEPSVNSVDFTYTISSDNENYTVTGETSASLVITKPKTTVLLNTPHTFTTEDNDNWTSLTFDGPFPIGSKIILTFSKGGGIKLCDKSNHNLHVPAILNTLQQGSYSTDKGNLWMNVPIDDLVLEITSDIALYNKGNNPGDPVYLSANNPLNGLVIESGETVLDRVVVVYPDGYVEEEDVVFEYNFDNGNMDGISGWGNGSSGTIDNNALKLTNPSETNNVYDVQVAIDREYEEGNYTLTFKVRGSDAGAIEQVFQHYYTTTENGSEKTNYDNASTPRSIDITTQWSNITLQDISVAACNRFLFNIGKFKGDIYIDDLKLVKKLD